MRIASNPPRVEVRPGCRRSRMGWCKSRDLRTGRRFGWSDTMNGGFRPVSVTEHVDGSGRFHEPRGDETFLGETRGGPERRSDVTPGPGAHKPSGTKPRTGRVRRATQWAAPPRGAGRRSRVGQGGQDRLGQRCGVTRRHQAGAPGRGAGRDLPRAAGIGHDDGGAARERLDDDEAVGLGLGRREHEQVEVREEIGDVGTRHRASARPAARRARASSRAKRSSLPATGPPATTSCSPGRWPATCSNASSSTSNPFQVSMRPRRRRAARRRRFPPSRGSVPRATGENSAGRPSRGRPRSSPGRRRAGRRWPATCRSRGSRNGG